MPPLLKALALILLAAAASGQEVTLPQTVSVAPGRLAAVEMSYVGDDFAYSVPPELDAFREYTTDPKIVRLRVLGDKPGIFQITAVATKAVDGKGKLSPFKTCLVVVGQGPAVPTTTPPATPQIPPPADPTLPPPPAPRGAAKAILMYEDDPSFQQPPSLKDPAVETWLHANVPGAWYRWDDDYLAASFSKYPPAVADLYLFGKASRPDNQPSVVVEFKDGQRRSYTVPEKPADLLKLLESFGPVLKVSAVTLVYEKDLHVVPAPVSAALNTLNRQGILANLFEDDTVDGTGQTPDQYKVPLAAANGAGFPASSVLVVTAGATVIRTVKGPKTEQEVLEAVKP